MTEDPQGIKGSLNERMRLIRFRRKKEKLRFWQEFKLGAAGSSGRRWCSSSLRKSSVRSFFHFQLRES